MAIFCGCLTEGRRPRVFGDGRQTRDWVEVGDAVSANLLAAASQVTGAVNVGWGRETSVLELIETLRDVAEREIADPEFAFERPGEVRRSAVDPTRARAELGWVPKVELPEGLRRVLAAG